MKLESQFQYIPSDEISFIPEAGLNDDPNDYKTLKNKPFSGLFAIDFESTSGSAGDGTYRVVNFIGKNGDRGRFYTDEIIIGRGNTTAKITRRQTISPTANIFRIPSGSVVEIYCAFNSTTQTLRINPITGSYRYLRGSSLDINSANPHISFIVSSIADMTFDMRYSTSAGDRPLFGMKMQIN